jgi:hypothetical protein
MSIESRVNQPAGQRPKVVDGPVSIDAAAQVPLQPAIVICIGGTGIDVGNELRRLKTQFVSDHGGLLAAKQQADAVVLIGIDSWKSPALLNFGSGHYVVIPGDPLLVNERVKQHWAANEDFSQAWVSYGGHPHWPGDFFTGAGQDRSKGRLGWTLNSLEGRTSVSSIVSGHLQTLLSALGPVGAVDTVPIYIVRGVSGGTGSGVGGAIAVELRKNLPNNCSIIGVEILNDAAELKVSGPERTAIRANAAGALAENDRIKSRNGAPQPYFRDRQTSTEHTIERDVFVYTYLFGAVNASGLFLKKPGEVEAHAAHCLASEIFLPSTSGVHGPASQFLMRATELPTYQGRSWTYASAAVSELRYEPHVVADYLGVSFARDAVTKRMLPDAAHIDDLRPQIQNGIEEFLTTEQVAWGTGLRTLLQKGYPNAPRTRPAPTLTGNPVWTAATASNAAMIVRQEWTKYEDWRARTFLQTLDDRRTWLLRNVRGGDGGSLHSDGTLFVEFAKHLGRTDGDGVAYAYAFLDEIEAKLENELDLVNTELAGPNYRLAADGGVKARYTQQSERFERAINSLATEMASGRFFKKNAKQAKETFETATWGQLATTDQLMRICNVAIGVLEPLISDVHELRRILKQRITDIDGKLNNAKERASRRLSNQEHGGKLDDLLLSIPELAEAIFAVEKSHVQDTQASAFISGDVIGGDGLIGLLSGIVDRRLKTPSEQGNTTSLMVDRAIGAAQKLFWESADRLNVWSALYAEMQFRPRVGLIDKALEEALLEAEQLVKGHSPSTRAEELRIAQIQRYAEHRLKICMDRAAPWWRLDSTMRIVAPPPAAHPRPFKFTIVGYDEDAYNQFIADQGTRNFLHDITSSLGVNPTARFGKNSLTIYNREGLVPLFYLDQERYGGPLLEAARAVQNGKPLMTDSRFDPEIVEFDPPETPGDQRRLVIAASLLFGLASQGDQGDIAYTDNTGATHAFANVRKFEDDLHYNMVVHQDLVDQIHVRIDTLADHDREPTMARLQILMSEREHDATRRQSNPDQRWWQQVGDVLKRRKRRGSLSLV